MKTQMTKNAVIVPVGSKGGFVLKNAPAGKEELKAFVRSQYQNFIRGLLDLTDNIVNGQTVHPPELVLYDDYDPYLVVAADKGTATFSDLANEVSEEYGFWLGDAFASGGSYGYDHKEEGITARGAWECVTRHFQEMGIDPMKSLFTVAGIGDMSGDVFGNGMIYTDRIRLLAAFNHTHIFLDPDPDPDRSFAERKRLFENPSLTWNDYDRAAISEGGGVFMRHSKAIPLTPQIQRLLGLEAETASGQELVRRILQLEVDLLWNGGIGTYVKATTETNSQVGDPANNGVRIDAVELRARVVGEGGNLGLTQLARIEYGLGGGRINTDAIDNSGGVDMSDHEVNIKILLRPEVVEGRMVFEERNHLLEGMTDEVNRLVLANNHAHALCLSLAEREGAAGLDLFESLQNHLSQEGGLKPQVEFLPSAKSLELRRRAGQGYSRPELAILLAYAKMEFKRTILATALPDEPCLELHLFDYFPEALRERWADPIRRHPLRREIIATQLTNLLVGRLGPAFCHRICRETDSQPAEAIRAILMANEILGLDDLFTRLLREGAGVETEAQYRALAEVAAATQGLVQWLVLSNESQGDFGKKVVVYRSPLAELRLRLETLLPAETEGQRFRSRKQQFLAAGYGDGPAADLAAAEYLTSCLGVIDVAGAAGISLDEAARRFYRIGDAFALGWLRDQLAALRSEPGWPAVAVGGLIMDLRHVQKGLTAHWLRSGHGEDQMEDYFSRVPDLLERIRRTVLRLREEGRVDLAGGTVAARLLLQFLRLQTGE